MERVSGSESMEGMLGEDELREVISLQIVIDSVRAAGLEAASPLAAGSDAVLLVYGGEADGGVVAARATGAGAGVRQRTRGCGPRGTGGAGELLALVEWGGFGEGDAVFLLAAKDLEDMKSEGRDVERMPCWA